jgi:hypothetical protein
VLNRHGTADRIISSTKNISYKKNKENENGDLRDAFSKESIYNAEA